MKSIIKLVLAALILFLVSCGNYSNPISSEYNDQDNNNDHTPLFSGGSDRG